MKESDQPSFSPSEAFVDAALRESARLEGRERDDELVDRILTATIQQKTAGDLTGKRHAPDARMWWTGTAAVAAVLALLATLLAVIPFGNDRDAEEVLLVVRYGEPATPEVESTFENTPPPVIAPKPYDGLLDLVAPSDSLRTGTGFLADANLELTTVFGQSISKFPSKALGGNSFRQDSFRIRADSTTEESGERTYAGNVRIEYENFVIEAEEVRIAVALQENISSSGPLLAVNVRIEQPTEGRMAIARHLSFDPRNGSFLLTGLQEFRSPDRVESTFPADQVLLLGKSSYRIQSATPGPETVRRYASPLPENAKRR